MIKCLGKDRNGDTCRNNQLGESKIEFYQEEDMVICEDSIDINNTSENINVEELQNEFVPVVKNKTCTNCKKELPIEQFKGERQPVTKSCIKCREGFKKNDKNRNKEHRNEIARKNDSNPERKAVKKKWGEENYDKVAKTWMDYRQRKIEKLGTDEYLKKQAEAAKKWRDNNHEKMAEINENKKNSKEQNYNIYKRSAGIKNLEFTLTYAEYNKIVDDKCYYCDIIQEKGFNGIDRTNQTIGYIVDNCVSCCKICNYMKGSCSDEVFIKRIEHVLTFQNQISGNLYPQCFADHKGSSYNTYVERANKKDLEFTISEVEFNDIVNRSCFMCGKENTIQHNNGLDRLDSDFGYILTNLNSCCGECNYMKKTYEFNLMMDKFMLIYNKHKDDIFENNTYSNHSIVKTNKKSKEEIKENTIKKKQFQTETLKERYNDEEYKLKRALELARLRKEAKNP